MITTNNYFEKINSIDFKTLPEALQKGNEFVMKATSNGTDWNAYQNSDTIKKTIDLFIAKLNDEVGVSNKPTKQTATKKAIAKQSPIKVVKASVAPNKAEPAFVERMSEELKFIKRFVNMDGKTKLKDDILRFINSLQKSIVEKKIRKTSSYADQIKFIQQKLIDTYKHEYKNKN
jgi:hypothetical protein